MTIRFECSKCKKKLRAPEKLAGKKAKCPDCGAMTAIPKPAKQAASVASGSDLGFEVVEDPSEVEEKKASAKKGKSTKVQKPCPECEEMIPETAVICRFCGAKFDLATQEEKARQEDELKKKKKQSQSSMIAFVILVLVLAGAGGAIFMMNQ